MKIRIITLVMLAMAIFVASAQADPTFPKPVGYVNDFAHKFTPEQVKTLNDKLEAYDKATTIQFVVVTVDSLQGYSEFDFSLAVAKGWGVGQKGANNGLLFLWAPNERRYFLQLGYGVEADITDGQAGSLQRQYLVPLLKQDKGYEAVNSLVDAVIAHLGNIPIQQREEERARKAKQKQLDDEAAAAASARFWGYVGWGVGILLVLALIVYGGYRLIKLIREIVRKSKLRKDLNEKFDSDFSDLKEARSTFTSTAANFRSALKVQTDLAKHDELESAGLHLFTDREYDLRGLRSHLDDDVDYVHRNYPDPDISEVDNIEDQMADLVKDYQRALKKAPVKLQAAREAMLRARSDMELFAKKGYKIDIEHEIKSASDAFGMAEKTLNSEKEDKDPRTVINYAERCIELADEISGATKRAVQTQNATNALIASLRREITRLDTQRQTAVPNHVAALGAYPKSVTELLNSKTAKYLRDTWVKDWTKKLDFAADQNSMEKQNFVDASAVAKEVEGLVAEARQALEYPKALKVQLTNAYRESIDLFHKLERQAPMVRNEVNHEDVGSETKSLYKKGDIAFNSMKSIPLDNQYQNWIEILNTLSMTSSKFEASLNAATADKQKAKRARDRAAEEERESARRRARSSSSSNYGGYSGSYSGSSSSSSSGGFGGFGGGGFGGGGAGGGY